MAPSEYVSVGGAAEELAEQLGQQIRPRWITDLFYQRELRNDLCPIVAGRRLIPRGYLPEIRKALVKRRVVQTDETIGAASPYTLKGRSPGSGEVFCLRAVHDSQPPAAIGLLPITKG